jgi:hypothetical protein
MTVRRWTFQARKLSQFARPLSFSAALHLHCVRETITFARPLSFSAALYSKRQSHHIYMYRWEVKGQYKCNSNTNVLNSGLWQIAAALQNSYRGAIAELNEAIADNCKYMISFSGNILTQL